MPIVSAGLLALAFPPFGVWPLALVALAPLLIGLWHLPAEGGRTWKRLFRAGWRGYLFGVFFFSGTLWWIGHVTMPGMIALCLYLALYPAVWAAFVALIGPPAGAGAGLRGALGVWGKVLLIAAAWCGLEWLRGTLLTGFPWCGPAVPLQARYPGELVRFIGITGFSVVPLIVSGAAALLCLKAMRRPLPRGTGIIALIVILAAAVRIPFSLPAATPPANGREVILVQQNVPMEVKMSPDVEVQADRYRELIRLTDEGVDKLAPLTPDLVIWPESAIPGTFYDDSHTGVFAHFLKRGGLTLVTGADTIVPKIHNNLAAIRSEPNNFVLHPKVHLVPFGEFIPLRKELPWMARMLENLIPLDFARGTSLEPVRPEGQPFQIIPAVCFEDTVGELMRKFVREGEDQVIVNITNDNWFRESPATELHFTHARWRAAELQRPMIRCANTGVTAVLDSSGQMISRLPSHVQGVLHARVPVSPAAERGLTFYARHGDLFSKVCLALSAVAFAGALVRSRLRRRKEG